MGPVASSDSLIKVGRNNWRAFLPMWLLPFAFFLTVFLPGWATHPYAYFFFWLMPLLGVCGYPALKPWRERRLTFTQMFFWFAVVPFVIWTLIILGIFALAFAAKVLNGSSGAV
jgi:hypothetical protein